MCYWDDYVLKHEILIYMCVVLCIKAVFRIIKFYCSVFLTEINLLFTIVILHYLYKFFSNICLHVVKPDPEYWEIVPV